MPSIIALIAMLYGASSMALINGQRDQEARYGGVVSLWINAKQRCSATKIAPRTFLTAAHCVIDVPRGTLADAFQSGGAIRLGNKASIRMTDTRSAQVEATSLPPAFADGLRRLHAYHQRKIADYRTRYSGDALAQRIRVVQAESRISDRFPDVALVRIVEATPEIPVLSLDLRALPEHAEVILVGYGCNRVDEWRRSDRAAQPIQRTWAHSRVIRVDAVNFYTEADGRRPGSATLCPGDSGGPVIFKGRVVGVHGTVWGLNHRNSARSNMSVNLHTLADWDAWRRLE